MKRPVYVKHSVSNIIMISKIITIDYLKYTKDFCFTGERHDFWEMVYCDKESVIIRSDDDEFCMEQGYITFHKPNEFHGIRANGENDSNAFIVCFETKSPLMHYFDKKIIPISQDLKEIIHKINVTGHAAFELPNYTKRTSVRHENARYIVKKNAAVGSQQLVRIYMELFLIFLMRHSEEELGSQVFMSKKSLDSHLVDGIITYMKKNIYERITMKDICSQFYYGKTYLAETFKNALGHSMMQHLAILKIEEAKKLLENKTVTVSEISARLKYESPQYFSRRFKAITGMPPSEYASMERKKT